MWAGVGQSIWWLATRWRSGDRIPVRAKFSAPVQTGPGANPASCTIGTASFPGDKAAGAWSWPPTPHRAKVKERVELHLYSPSGPSWPLLGRTSSILLLSCSDRKYTKHHTDYGRACVVSLNAATQKREIINSNRAYKPLHCTVFASYTRYEKGGNRNFQRTQPLQRNQTWVSLLITNVTFCPC
jgi:hypothetical protein